MNIYLIGICISFVVYLVISFFIGRKVKDANDFFVAGRKAPVGLIVGSMIASYVSTGMFMGDAGEYYSGLFSPMTILATMQVAGYIYGAVFFGCYLRRSEVYTIPEFFGKRFCSEKVRILATVTSIITMVVYLLSVVQGIGTLMSFITGLEYNLCIVLSLIVFVFITMFSGASGVLITDTIMFAVFTGALVLSAIVIIFKAGGWSNVVEQLTNMVDKPGLLSWGGNTEYMYSDPWMNVGWGIVYGVVWMSVCMAGPWQSSRYLMAKNEHTVIRSSLYSAFGIFALQLIVGMTAVTINVFSPEMSSASHVLIWGATNLLPTLLGVILLTGVLAAGISSATTFLSLVGSSVANDIFRGKGNSIRIGRYSMLAVAIVVLLLAVFNPPQILVIMYFGGTIVAASWLPVCIASILSKRVTKEGAFWGMLMGFFGCFFVKLFTHFSGITLPVYLDPTVVGMVMNIITLVLVSMFTKVTEEEKEARAKLFIIPESEKDPVEIKKTKTHLMLAVLLGVIVFVVLALVWAIPVMF